ncbi:SAM-dependent methyltransferase [Crossiella equi]|uniref:SAM-dependent methyltransferase n=1 Tax=Crossiella equi TaxID=130796 RepID=A0ABS5AQJ9_9PSEU|nr:class I SAM-dependent methyltransferase [Crossiella equi]MBP2478716.1 SAM-dependent methyltransferase [Crossiella equi]
MSYSPEWLALRENADAEARATDLLTPLRAALAGQDRPVVRDLGCGTGSLARWLAPHLPGPAHWVLHDVDADLLAHAEADLRGRGFSVETRLGDLADLRAEHFAGTSLVAASALLDILTEPEVNGLAAAIVGSGVPAYFCLSVSGKTPLDPAEPLDTAFQEAFNDHQRREHDGRRLLGPDAPEAATRAFERLGARVHTSPSPWRLGPDKPELTGTWLRNWVAAAVEQEPALAADAPAYLARRAATPHTAEVGHVDLLALPGAA